MDLGRQDFPELADHLGMFSFIHVLDVQEFPLDARQLVDPWKAQQIPLRSSFLQRNKKLPFFGREGSLEPSDQDFPYVFQLFISNGNQGQP